VLGRWIEAGGTPLVGGEAIFLLDEVGVVDELVKGGLD
jgi:hypothetical protein